MLQPMSEDAKRLADTRSSIALEGMGKKMTNDGTSTEWREEDVMTAVRDIVDMGEKCMLYFIALGDFAKAVHNHQASFYTDKLELAMPINSLTPEIKSLFRTWGFEETKYGYKYYFTPPTKWSIKIPVEIHVYKRHYQFFDNPDKGWVGVDDFRIPNPFDSYWKARFLIQ